MAVATFPRIDDRGCDEESADTPVDVFRAALLSMIAPTTGTEVLALADGIGRIIAADIRSPIALPGFDRAAMDGFGVGAGDLCEGKLLRIATSSESLSEGTAVRLHTGGAIPRGVVAVVRRERAAVQGEMARLRESILPGADIRRRGEDFREGTTIARAGAAIDARLTALLAACGIAEVTVRRRVRVAVLSTGNELVGRDGAQPPVHDSNRPMLLALLAGPGVEMIDGGIVGDDAAAQADRLRDLTSRADLIVCTGGTAGSPADVLPDAIARAGGTARACRLALRPGRPILLGRIGRAVLLGLPGNPLAAFVTAQLFAGPAIVALAGGRRHHSPAGQPASLAEPRRDRPRIAAFVPCVVTACDADGRPILRLLPSGSGRLLPLAESDGLAELAPDGAVRFYRDGRIG
ncbi:MAG: molybdopterin molybdotransferase MoeA [Bauldia sp.]